MDRDWGARGGARLRPPRRLRAVERRIRRGHATKHGAVTTPFSGHPFQVGIVVADVYEALPRYRDLFAQDDW